jgi:hypothetical protein
LPPLVGMFDVIEGQQIDIVRPQRCESRGARRRPRPPCGPRIERTTSGSRASPSMQSPPAPIRPHRREIGAPASSGS